MDAELQQLLNHGRKELQFMRERTEFVHQQLETISSQPPETYWDTFARCAATHLTPYEHHFLIRPDKVLAWPDTFRPRVIELVAPVFEFGMILCAFCRDQESSQRWVPESDGYGRPRFTVPGWRLDERVTSIEATPREEHATTHDFAIAVALAEEAHMTRLRLLRTFQSAA